MFPNNPLYVEKLVQTKQADILRELPDHIANDFQGAGNFSTKLKVKARTLAPVALLVALGSLFIVVF